MRIRIIKEILIQFMEDVQQCKDIQTILIQLRVRDIVMLLNIYLIIYLKKKSDFKFEMIHPDEIFADFEYNKKV